MTSPKAPKKVRQALLALLRHQEERDLLDDGDKCSQGHTLDWHYINNVYHWAMGQCEAQYVYPVCMPTSDKLVDIL